MNFPLGCKIEATAFPIGKGEAELAVKAPVVGSAENAKTSEPPALVNTETKTKSPKGLALTLTLYSRYTLVSVTGNGDPGISVSAAVDGSIENTETPRLGGSKTQA